MFTTVLLIVLLVATAVELATVTATEALVTGRRDRSLAHDLALDSTPLVLADRLESVDGRASTLEAALDQTGVAVTQFTVGDVIVTCELRDDGAKLNPNLWAKPYEKPTLSRKLALLGARRQLPDVAIRLRPLVSAPPQEALRAPYRWFDQVLDEVKPGTIFPFSGNATVNRMDTVWSDAITVWGDGRLDLRRVDVATLETLLEDIRPGLAQRILLARQESRRMDFTSAALATVDASIRAQVAARLTFDAKRYAVVIDTAIDADRRRWFVVFRGADQGLEVLHRGRLTW